MSAIDNVAAKGEAERPPSPRVLFSGKKKKEKKKKKERTKRKAEAMNGIK